MSANPRLEVVSALVLAPLVEEAIFRLAMYRLAAAIPAWRWPVAALSTALFGLMHQRFGPRFVAYASVGGVVLWATQARTGYRGAVLVHLLANVVDLSVGWRRTLMGGNQNQVWK